jgi:hypothetical protein
VLTNILDQLGALLSRQFIIAHFVPVLLFGFLNVLLLAWQSEVVRDALPRQIGLEESLYVLPALIVLAIIAYLLSAVSVYLRLVLEGRRLPKSFVLAFGRRERARHARSDEGVQPSEK